MRSTHLLLGGLGAALVLGAGLTATAFAAGGTSGTPAFSFMSDLASHLGISTTKLDQAVKSTELDKVNALLKAGTITTSQAQKLEQAIQSGKSHLGGWEMNFGHHGFGHLMRGGMSDLASVLGLTPQTLMQDLQGGKTLAQIITAQGKTTSEVESQLQNQLKTRLDTLVANGRLTTSQESTILSDFAAHFQNLLNATWPMGPGAGWNGGMGSSFQMSGPSGPSI